MLSLIGSFKAIFTVMSEAQKLILIIDDDSNLQEILSLKLTKLGFSVDHAKDGPSGIEKAKKKRPDLILLDVNMPGMSGIQVLSKIKSDPETKDLKVIFLTNFGEVQEENSWVDDKFAKEAGALGHIKKTDDLDKIVARIQQELTQQIVT